MPDCMCGHYLLVCETEEKAVVTDCYILHRRISNGCASAYCVLELSC